MTRDPIVTPFLWLPEKAREAAELYVSLLPDSRITFIEEPFPGTQVISFELMGRAYVIMQHPRDSGLTEAFSISVRVDGQGEVDRLWDALLPGGSEHACGWLTDRFGVTWQITPMQFEELRRAGTPAQAEAVGLAMMSMKKFDVAALEAAFEGAAP